MLGKSIVLNLELIGKIVDYFNYSYTVTIELCLCDYCK